MKRNALKLAVLVALLAATPALAQVRRPPKLSDPATDVIEYSESLCLLGELELKSGKTAEAKKNFDKAVDVILDAEPAVRADPRVSDHLNKLIERIHQITTGTVVSKNLPPASTPTQEGKCNMTIAQSPPARGFRLGMSFNNGRGSVSGARTQLSYVGKFGEGRTILGRYELPAEHAKGVREVEIEYLDGVITSIQVEYDGSVKWGNAREFASAISEGLKLTSSWNEVNKYNVPQRNPQEYILDCGAFKVNAHYGWGVMPKLRIYDPRAPEIIESRKLQQERKAREVFKP